MSNPPGLLFVLVAALLDWTATMTFFRTKDKGRDRALAAEAREQRRLQFQAQQQQMRSRVENELAAFARTTEHA